MYEVEQKYRLSDVAGFEAQVATLGARFGEPVLQADDYFAHPDRDFATTDEALRIRTVGDANFVTYKGPKIDAATKTRREIELPIEHGADGAARFRELLLALGFRSVATVRKRRRTAHVVWQDRNVEIVVDAVDALGDFCELETTADQPQLDAARQAIASLAIRLELRENERRSYLELLLEKASSGKNCQ